MVKKRELTYLRARGSKKFIVWVSPAELEHFRKIMSDLNLTADEKSPGRHEIQFTFSHSQAEIENLLKSFNDQNSM